jgi:lipopolysaccharide transport system ATP-binding protein
MSDTVISVEKLSKRYLVGHQSARHETALRNVIAREARNFTRKAFDFVYGRQIIQGDEVEEFWALNDVSFEVKQGEVLGIIGRNGAGKSTLLKVLSRITEPTGGRARIKGRVSSLLEVGTGFHPELTGRENIYLNGAILGMTRAEIKRKFDEIVAFAEVEKFLDTPVKRYSSGMYVRLAFAVAAHLEPEILIVDEVLAVGDAEFQRKCLGKISEVAGGGRTVLFVSHNPEAIRRICTSGLLLAEGCVRLRNTVERCIDQYIAGSTARQAGHVLKFPKNISNRPHIVRIEILDDMGAPLPSPKTWDYVKFRVYFRSPAFVKSGSVELYISTAGGTILTRCSTSPDSAIRMNFWPGENYVDCNFPCLTLSAGIFVIGAGLAIPNVEWFDNQPYAAELEVHGSDVFESGMAPAATRYLVPMTHAWQIPVHYEPPDVGSAGRLIPNKVIGEQ